MEVAGNMRLNTHNPISGAAVAEIPVPPAPSMTELLQGLGQVQLYTPLLLKSQGGLLEGLVRVAQAQDARIRALEARAADTHFEKQVWEELSRTAERIGKAESFLASSKRNVTAMANKLPLVDRIPDLAERVEALQRDIADMGKNLGAFLHSANAANASEGGRGGGVGKKGKEGSAATAEALRQMSELAGSGKSISKLQASVKKQEQQLLRMMKQVENYNQNHDQLKRQAVTRDFFEKRVHEVSSKLAAKASRAEVQTALAARQQSDAAAAALSGDWGIGAASGVPGGDSNANDDAAAAAHSTFSALRCLTCDRLTPNVPGPRQSEALKSMAEGSLEKLFTKARKEVALYSRGGIGVFRGTEFIAPQSHAVAAGAGAATATAGPSRGARSAAGVRVDGARSNLPARPKSAAPGARPRSNISAVSSGSEASTEGRSRTPSERPRSAHSAGRSSSVAQPASTVLRRAFVEDVA